MWPCRPLLGLLSWCATFKSGHCNAGSAYRMKMQFQKGTSSSMYVNWSSDTAYCIEIAPCWHITFWHEVVIDKSISFVWRWTRHMILPENLGKYPVTRHFFHDDVITLKHYPRYWPFVRGIHRSPVNSPHRGQWRGALGFSLICALNKQWRKQSWGWWFGMQFRSLWRHYNGHVTGSNRLENQCQVPHRLLWDLAITWK